MSKSKTRRRRARPPQRGGVMLGMRSGFRGMTDAVAGGEASGKSRWVAPLVVALLALAAVGLLLMRP